MWLFLSFLTALCTSFQDILGKRLSPRVSPYVIAWAWTFFSLPFLLILLFWEKDIHLGPEFWPALATSTLALTIGGISLFKAIESSDVSLTIPILSLTPLFLLVTSPLMLGEFPSAWGLVGILFIVCGSYILFYHSEQSDLWAPFRRLFSTRGSRYMLLVAFVFSIGANVDKIGIRNSSPVVWSILLNAVVSVVLGVIMFSKVKDARVQISKNWFLLFLMGLAVALVMVFQMNALRLAIVPYVIAIKRTSILMTSLWGIWFFKEQGGRQRLLAALIMTLGVGIISFSK